jgi:hypothetical protein
LSRHPVARTLVYTHRWLGIALGLLFLLWFVSGVIMMYARMPELDPGDRLAALAPLNPAVFTSPLPPAALSSSIRLTMFEGRPVYRFIERGRPRVVFADTGEALAPLNIERAQAVVRTLPFAASASPRFEGRLEDADQWTFGVRGRMPLLKFALDDAAGTRVYVTEQTGEPAMVTTASGRRWGWMGAVIHWIYFTPFRRQSELWAQTIIWVSIAGVVMSLAGLLWGIWRYSPWQRFRLKREQSHSPYAGWMLWHHYAGLIFGITTITWIFSGLLSMDPWDWSPSTAPTRAQRDAVSGGPLLEREVSLEELRRALAAFVPATKEVTVVRFRNEVFLRADRGLVSLQAPEMGPAPMLNLDQLFGAAREAHPSAAIAGMYWMDTYDAYYYDRHHRLSLPVLRVRYDDPQATWLYLDPRAGAIVRKEERLSRLNRWLYHGLHSFDFPFLYDRRPLWDVIVIVFSLGGIVLSVTTLLPAYRRVRRWARLITSREGSS